MAVLKREGEKLRQEASDWASRLAAELKAGRASSIGGVSLGAKPVAVDKKEVTVWKLPPSVDRDEF